MPPRPRTTAQLADRRQSMLRQARALAAEAGWDAVTMRAVAARVGLNPPALYEQFAGGKADLLAAVAIEGFGELADALEQATTDQNQPLLAIAEGYWRFASDKPALYELMFHHRLEFVFATDDTPPQVRRGFAVLRRAIATRIGDGRARRRARHRGVVGEPARRRLARALKPGAPRHRARPPARPHRHRKPHRQIDNKESP